MKKKSRSSAGWIALVLGVVVVGFIALVVGIVFLFLVVYQFGYRPNQMVGQSMAPAYPNGAYILTDHTAYIGKKPERGDVVKIRAYYNGQEVALIKRVIGVPGDAVEIRDGKVWLDGKDLEEPYVTGPTDPGRFFSGAASILVPDHSYILLGDNRPRSADSRNSGFVSDHDILAKVLFCYWNCK